jgi:hypothetical protein
MVTEGEAFVWLYSAIQITLALDLLIAIAIDNKMASSHKESMLFEVTH